MNDVKILLDRSITNLERKMREAVQDGWLITGELQRFDMNYCVVIQKFELPDWADEDE